MIPPSWLKKIFPALLIAIATSTSSSAETGDSAPREVLAWLETLKFPSLRDCPYVIVTIAEKNPAAGNPAQFVKIDGILLSETQNELKIFVLELKEKLDTYYPMMDPPFWPVTIATIQRDSSDERATYTVRRYAETAREIQKELDLPNKDEINAKLWDEAVFRHLPKPAAIAVFASACQQNHEEKIAAEMISGIDRTYERYLSDGQQERPFGKFLEDALSETLLWCTTLKFKDVTVPRAQLLTEFGDLKERFPRSRHAEYMQRTINILEPMVREDNAHGSLDLSTLSGEEKIRELIFRLRDQHGAQTMQPGMCDIFYYDKPDQPSVAGDLVKIGYAAVPQLIATLDDERFSRSIHFWRGYVFSHYVLRVGDCAQQILERIANRKFYDPKATGSDMTSDREVASTKKAVEEWWAAFQKKGEKQSLIDAVSAGDENSPAQAETLLQKYNDSAPQAIMTGVNASKEDRIRATLLVLLTDTQGDEVVPFFRRQMKEAPGLKTRTLAAQILLDRGEAESVTSGIREWKNISPKLAHATWHDDDEDAVEDLIEFLANSGRTDAVKALAQSVQNVSADTRSAIVSALAPTEHKLGLRRLARSGQPKLRAGDADADREAQALLVSMLNGKDLLSASGGIGEKDLNYSKGRLCDYAAFVLAKRWPQKYKFYWSLNWKENDRQLDQLISAWRKDQ